MLLPWISTSSLFTLLYLWTIFPTVHPLPLPIGDNNAPVFFGPPQPPIYIQIAIANKDTPKEHAFVAIGHTLLHAVYPTNTDDTQLIPQKEAMSTKAAMEAYRLKMETIGEAKFGSKFEEGKVIEEELLKIKLPPIAENGSCWDFIMIALKKMMKDGWIVGDADSVLEKYRDIYEERKQARMKRDTLYIQARNLRSAMAEGRLVVSESVIPFLPPPPRAGSDLLANSYGFSSLTILNTPFYFYPSIPSTSPRLTKDSILVPQKDFTLRIQMKTEGSPKTTSIGKALFKGTCVDYIRMVLQKFKDRGIIVGSVLESYEKIYE
ncbi:hypothetical protein EV368DRAFT_67381 [Lentinula lateritia]|nr:hypothetical protein EV368DRAFT_67381 [Lentinula lateritia]